MMPRGNELLMPANPVFIWLSLLLAFCINLFPWGRWPGVPDVLAVAVVFWNVHQPRRVGIGGAFIFGLVMDVHQGALLGQHALAYTLLSFFAITIHRRLLWFTTASQAMQVLPLFFAGHLVSVIVRMSAGAGWPGWPILFAPILESLMWPLATFVLLAPQRLPPDRDKNRPL